MKSIHPPILHCNFMLVSTFIKEVTVEITTWDFFLCQ